jgi:exodeoxyribonuclease VII large subunit
MPESVWVRAEISDLSGKNGNLYLQLTERTERGDPLGRGKAVIWKSRAIGISSRFAE